MNILQLPAGGSAVGVRSMETLKPTSCEGYVTKRGHFRKSWRVRYLVLNGADLLVSYYESRDACHSATGTPKGSFYLSNIEKHEYKVGVVGAKEKPFGFRMIGHAPKKGYVELDIFVETLADANKWIEVAQNALEGAQRLTRKTIDESLTTKTFFGFSSVASPQQQIKKLHVTKEEYLKDALREIESAKAIGRDACNEIVVQGEKLDNIETDLGGIENDLDYADKLLNRLKNPMLHLFSNDNRPKPKNHANSSTHGAPNTSSSLDSAAFSSSSNYQGTSDLERLALALGELEQQATLINFEAVKSTQQIEHIEQRLTAVNNLVQTQTKRANANIQSGGNLF